MTSSAQPSISEKWTEIKEASSNELSVLQRELVEINQEKARSWRAFDDIVSDFQTESASYETEVARRSELYKEVKRETDARRRAEVQVEELKRTLM
jgi:hypothetical protein